MHWNKMKYVREATYRTSKDSQVFIKKLLSQPLYINGQYIMWNVINWVNWAMIILIRDTHYMNIVTLNTIRQPHFNQMYWQIHFG